MSLTIRNTAGFYCLTIVIATAIFAFDLSLPLGVAAGVPYVALVLFGLWAPSSGHILVLAGIASALTVLGYAYSPEGGGIPWIVLTNRALALFVIWVSAIIAYKLRRGRQNLEEQSALLDTTFDTIEQGLNVYDEKGMLLHANAAYEKMFGFPPGYLHPGITYEQITRFRAESGHFGKGDIEKMVHDRVNRRDLRAEYIHERTLENGLTYLLQRKSMPGGGYVNVFTDITPLKQQEEEIRKLNQGLEEIVEERTAELRASEGPFRAAFESTAVGLGIRDLRNGSYMTNPALQAMLGYSADELQAMHMRDIMAPENPKGHEAMREKLLSGEIMKHQNTVCYIRKDGKPVWIYNDRSLLLDDDGAPSMVINLHQDMTALKDTEQVLQQAQKMEAVGQLTGGIAHDFNNLLAVIVGNVELAEEICRTGGDPLPFLTTVKHASERGATLTNQLLAFSRKQTLFPQVVDAGQLVDNMKELLHRSLGETIEIRTSGDTNLWSCEVDPHHLESALLNLVINARDAMPVGGALTIRTANADLRDGNTAAETGVLPGKYVLLSVTDTGTGMTQEVLEQAFEPFFTTKEIGQGSGLGLSMVHGFVNQSGGHVSISSIEGKGTTIGIYLPRSKKVLEAAKPNQPEDLPRAEGETVLVVEDDPEVRKLSVTLLRSFGYDVVEAEEAVAALSTLDATPGINLLFTDVVLPGTMSGPELAAEAYARRPDLAVLYTSGYTDLANFDRSVLIPGVELLQKPFHKAELARKLRSAIDAARP